MLKLMFRCRNVHGLFDISFLLLFSTVFSMFFSVNFKIGLKKWKKKRPKADFFKPGTTLEGNWLLPNLHGIDLSQQYTWVLISGRNFLTSCSVTNNTQWICRPSPRAAQMSIQPTGCSKTTHYNLKTISLAGAQRSTYGRSLTNLVAKARAWDRTSPNAQVDHAQSPRSIWHLLLG